MLNIHYLQSLFFGGQARGQRYPLSDTQINKFPNTPLKMLQTDRLSLSLTECFGFHLVIACKRRMQEAKCYYSRFPELTTQDHSWTQQVTHTRLFGLFPNVQSCLWQEQSSVYPHISLLFPRGKEEARTHAHKTYLRRFRRRNQGREKGRRSRGELELPGRVLEKVGQDGASTAKRTTFHQEKGQVRTQGTFLQRVGNWGEPHLRKQEETRCWVWEVGSVWGADHGELALRGGKTGLAAADAGLTLQLVATWGRAPSEMKSSVPCPKIVKYFKTTIAQRCNKHRHEVRRLRGHTPWSSVEGETSL